MDIGKTVGDHKIRCDPNSTEPGLCWDDVAARYDKEADIFRLLFSSSSSSTEITCDGTDRKRITPNVWMVINGGGGGGDDGAILRFEFENASRALGVSLDTPQIEIDGRPPCILRHCYSLDEDALDIYFMPRDQAKGRFHHNRSAPSPYQYDVALDMDEDDRCLGLSIVSASNVITK